MQEECGPFVCGPTVCLNPTAACLTEHMFSTRELKQKRPFVITYSFVSICPPLLLPTPSFSNIQTKALVETLTAREREARMPSRNPSPAPRPRELLSSQRPGAARRYIYLFSATVCSASQQAFYPHHLI